MQLPKKLRSLVGQSVALFGEVIRRELGDQSFQSIENLRQSMANLRLLSEQKRFICLQKNLQMLEDLPPKSQSEIAHSFTLMLELMNVCENSYRSHRLSLHRRKTSQKVIAKESPQAIVYVLTAHPTEARSPQNIYIFHQIQNLLIEILDCTDSESIEFTEKQKNDLWHALEIAWRTPIVRSRKPKVKDEAEHIYSLLFRDDNVNLPVYVRSWVGGDKDGHPGVNEKTFLQSLELSRRKLLIEAEKNLSEVRRTLKVFSAVKLQKNVLDINKVLRNLKKIKISDAQRIQIFRDQFFALKADYLKLVGAQHPSIERLSKLIHTFPALAVPLEFREDSAVLMTATNARKPLAIYKMLSALERISRGGDPKWYVRGFIISMTSSIEHIRAAGEFQRSIFGGMPLPIIPLFEEAKSLRDSEKIISAMIADVKLKAAMHKNWKNRLEMMVGYSDSAKEAGVLASRLAISEGLPKLEKICERAGLIPIFFHGSGGSIDRGGGSIEDQTAWWPKSALRYYKVTVQGEMIERYFATPAIARRQLEKINENATRILNKPFRSIKNPAVEKFSADISACYQKNIQSAEFLKVVELATPYSYLKVLKIGSRPSKRSVQLSVKNLRAIPWVLCWTQTRVLFPTWWGVGSAWAKATAADRKLLRKAFLHDPVFTSYIKALGFTLAKIELSVWKMYLQNSGLTELQILSAYQEFKTELQLTKKCFFELCVHKDFLWFRPWLGESIMLRSPMIHPLNLLQIIAKKKRDLQLLRTTITGISCGMLTTG